MFKKKNNDSNNNEDYWEEERVIKEEIINEAKEEFKSIGAFSVIALVVLFLLILLGLIFRNSITNGIMLLIDQVSTLSENSLFEDEITCTSAFNGSYSGEYTINNITYKEEVTLSDSSSYSLIFNNGESSSTGSYLLSNKKIVLTDSNNSLGQYKTYTYTISDDCKSLTKTTDGVLVKLTIE
jgi:hypothetical protein